MAVGAINSYDGKCPHGTEGYPPHNEIVGKVGCKDGRVWAVCGAHVKEYQRFPETFEIELYPIKELTMADTHYHPCPACQQAIECSLTIGDEGCKQVKCIGCSPTWSRPAIRGYFLCSTGWICPCGTTMGTDADGTHQPTCNRCGRPKPTIDGHSPHGEATPPQAIIEDGEECDNCSEPITPENPAREFDGGGRCKDCYPHCSKCKDELPDDTDEWSECDGCNDLLCDDCRFWCKCCEVYMCKNHVEDHGVN